MQDRPSDTAWGPGPRPGAWGEPEGSPRGRRAAPSPEAARVEPPQAARPAEVKHGGKREAFWGIKEGFLGKKGKFFEEKREVFRGAPCLPLRRPPLPAAPGGGSICAPRYAGGCALCVAKPRRRAGAERPGPGLSPPTLRWWRAEGGGGSAQWGGRERGRAGACAVCVGELRDGRRGEGGEEGARAHAQCAEWLPCTLVPFVKSAPWFPVSQGESSWGCQSK